MTAPVILVLSVFVKCGTLSLQSDGLLWSDRTHSRMMRLPKFGAFVAQALGQFWGNVCDKCVPERCTRPSFDLHDT